MVNEAELVRCYNHGCGKKFDPNTNTQDSCQHHPGVPFFHDAYKGWTCCNKKCTDFTEFLYIKGCTTSKHSNVEPVEPEKVQQNVIVQVPEIKPIATVTKKRPPIDTPLITMKPDIAPTLRKQLETDTNSQTPAIDLNNGEIPVGTICKNSGCRVAYQGPETDQVPCCYHSGSAIFHEGMKYWSCCQRKTSDFNTFLDQAGCKTGQHLWKKEEGNSEVVECRWDWHQTGSHVIISIYAKNYHPDLSVVQLNPVRLHADIVFPQQNNASFTLDLELKGVVDVEESELSMSPFKVEIKMKKAEPGKWPMVNIPKSNTKINKEEEILVPKVSAVDLSDL